MQKRKYRGESQIPYILVLIFILVSHLIFKGEVLKTFLLFIFLIPTFTIFKFDGRIPVVYALLLLILTAIVLAVYGNEYLANQLSIYAYWLLVVGVICLTIEDIREQNPLNERSKVS